MAWDSRAYSVAASVALLSVLLVQTPSLQADMIPGVDWYVCNAQAIALVRAQTAQQSAEYPAPEGRQRLVVEEVLLGFLPQQSLLWGAGAVPPGHRAVVLFQYEHPAHYEPAIRIREWKGGQARLLTSGSDYGMVETGGRNRDAASIDMRTPAAGTIATRGQAASGITASARRRTLLASMMESLPRPQRISTHCPRLALCSTASQTRCVRRAVRRFGWNAGPPSRLARKSARALMNVCS